MFDDPTSYPIVLAASVAAALVVGAVIGRRTGDAQGRIKALEAQVEAAIKEREFADAAAEAAKHEVARVREELREYRAGVVGHFAGTSGLLRELTHQYRAVYEHLTDGATSLCPKGSIDQLEALRTEKLPEFGSPSPRKAPPTPATPGPSSETAATKAPPAAPPPATPGPSSETAAAKAPPAAPPPGA